MGPDETLRNLIRQIVAALTVNGVVIGSITSIGSITNALPAGNNNIGDVDIASIAAGSNVIGKVGIDQTTPGTTNKVYIGTDGQVTSYPQMWNGAAFIAMTGDSGNGLDVDVTRVPTDPFGANADAASATGSISAKLRFIASTGIPITGTVTVGSHAVTNAGTFAVQVDGNALTSLQLIDDVVYTDDTSTHSTGSSKGVLMMAAATPTDTAVNANDIGALAMSLGRELYVVVRDAAGNNRGLNIDASGQLAITVASIPSHAVTNAGTFAVQVDGNALTSLQLIDDIVHSGDAAVSKYALMGAVFDDTSPGTVTENQAQSLRMSSRRALYIEGPLAHDAADAANPVKTGAKALDIGTNPSDVATNDIAHSTALRNGTKWVLGGSPNIVNKHIQVTDADGAQTDTALVTVSAGTAIVVTSYEVQLDAATTATGGVAVRMGFGTANTPSADAATGVLMAASGIPAGGGVAEGDGSGVIGMGASNEDLRLTCEDPAGGNLDIVVRYFTITIG